MEPLDSAVATQEPVQASVPIVIGDARGRSVHFDDSSHIEPTEKQPEDPGSPDSAMVESPLTEERPLDREAP